MIINTEQLASLHELACELADTSDSFVFDLTIEDPMATEITYLVKAKGSLYKIEPSGNVLRQHWTTEL